MREFLLKNALGATWSLNDVESFLSSPKGIGGERKTTYTQIGNSFVATENKIKQKNITGKITFADYQKFEDFCRFIQHRPLTLYYTAAHEYRIDVLIEKISKTEYEILGLNCEISMKGLTPWYKVISKANSRDSSSVKIYPYTYDYLYENSAGGSIEFMSDSTEESPIKLVIIGPCINPKWEHYLNDVKIADGEITCKIEAGHRLVVDATKIPYTISECDNTGTELLSLYQQSDFSTQRFLFAGYGENRIYITHEGEHELNAIIEARIEYEAI